MRKDKEYNQADELSRGLDYLHDGKQLVSQDKEINDLLEVAERIKHSFSPNELPKALIAEMAETLSKERKAQKQKWRSRWLYGGLGGAAAAVVMAAFGQFLLPQAPDNRIAQEINESQDKQQMTAAADPSGDLKIMGSAETVLSQPDQTNKGAETPVPLTLEKAADSVSKVFTDIMQGPEAPEVEQQTNQIAMLQQEAPQDIKMQKSADLTQTENKALRTNKNIQAEGKMNVIMVMPDQKAQSTRIDNTSGVIQQVYHLGSNDEIIVTQKLHEESAPQSSGDLQQDNIQALEKSTQVQPFAKIARNSNSITVKVDKYDITIEGEKTTTELQKIAKSLTAKTLEP